MEDLNLELRMFGRSGKTESYHVQPMLAAWPSRASTNGRQFLPMLQGLSNSSTVAANAPTNRKMAEAVLYFPRTRSGLCLGGQRLLTLSEAWGLGRSCWSFAEAWEDWPKLTISVKDWPALNEDYA
jgi:hypothetical protein